MKWWLILALLMVMAVAFLGGCQPKQLYMKLQDIEVSRMTFRQMDLVFVYEVYNPNAFSIDLSGMDYSIRSGGDVFVAGKIGGPLPPIGPTAAKSVKLPVTLDNQKIARMALKLGRHESIPYELAGQADFNVLGAKVPVTVNHQGSIALVQPPQWKFKTVRLGSDLNTVEVILSMTNPNASEMQLAPMHSALLVDGQRVIAVDMPLPPKLPGKQTTELVIPVRLDVLAAAGAVKRIAEGKRVEFDGQFNFDGPTSLKELILGQIKER